MPGGLAAQRRPNVGINLFVGPAVPLSRFSSASGFEGKLQTGAALSADLVFPVRKSSGLYVGLVLSPDIKVEANEVDCGDTCGIRSGSGTLFAVSAGGLMKAAGGEFARIGVGLMRFQERIGVNDGCVSEDRICQIWGEIMDGPDGFTLDWGLGGSWKVGGLDRTQLEIRDLVTFLDKVGAPTIHHLVIVSFGLGFSIG